MCHSATDILSILGNRCWISQWYQNTWKVKSFIYIRKHGIDWISVPWTSGMALCKGNLVANRIAYQYQKITWEIFTPDFLRFFRWASVSNGGSFSFLTSFCMVSLEETQGGRLLDVKWAKAESSWVIYQSLSLDNLQNASSFLGKGPRRYDCTVRGRYFKYQTKYFVTSFLKALHQVLILCSPSRK